MVAKLMFGFVLMAVLIAIAGRGFKRWSA